MAALQAYQAASYWARKGRMCLFLNQSEAMSSHRLMLLGFQCKTSDRVTEILGTNKCSSYLQTPHHPSDMSLFQVADSARGLPACSVRLDYIYKSFQHDFRIFHLA